MNRTINEIIRVTSQVSQFGESKEVKIEMLRTCMKGRCWVYREKDAGDGAVRQEGIEGQKGEVHGGGKGREETLRDGQEKKKK